MISPSQLPVHWTFVTELLIVIGGGSLKLIVVSKVQPLSSVIVNVLLPAHKSFGFWTTWPPGDQLKTKVPVPPNGEKDAPPSHTPLQVGSVVEKPKALILEGSVTLILKPQSSPVTLSITKTP